MLALILFITVLEGIARAQAPDCSHAASDFKKAISPYVRETTAPIYVYNWDHKRTDAELSITSESPEGFADFQSQAKLYWDKQKDKSNAKDMFGTGFYASVDPASTSSYGHVAEGKWNLTQIRIPAGFRMLDDNRDVGMKLPPDQQGLISCLGCPDNWKGTPFLNRILRPQLYMGNARCADNIRHLLKDELRIDGFTFAYGAVPLAGCTPPPGMESRTAFVITDSSRFKSDDVKVFSRLTKDSTEDRVRIQSLLDLATATQYGHSHGPSTLTAQLQPETMPGADFHGSILPTGKKFLWKDLEGLPSDKHLVPWLREHRFACTEQVQYRTPQDREDGVCARHSAIDAIKDVDKAL